MNPVAACPSRQEWESLIQGQVPFAQVEQLAQHLETCARCMGTVQGLRVDDTLVEVIRKQTRMHGKPPDAVLKAVMERLHVLRGPRREETAGVSGTGGVGAGVGGCSADRESYDFLAPPQGPDELGRLGSYRVIKVLGAGGMGVVFEAEDPHLSCKVALKAMKPVLAASDTAKQRSARPSPRPPSSTTTSSPSTRLAKTGAFPSWPWNSWKGRPRRVAEEGAEADAGADPAHRS